MKEKEIEDVDKVKMHVEFIIFEDGVAWSKGQTMRQDIKNPDTWWIDGLWINRRISSLKNRYGGQGSDLPPTTRQPPYSGYCLPTLLTKNQQTNIRLHDDRT
jgi:hypothetical protein